MRAHFLVPTAFLVACSSSGSETASGAPVPPPSAPTADAAAAAPAVEATLASYLVGRFDSKAQAARDRQYFAIQLRICRIQAEDIGLNVLYVEQARMDALAAPYRQRLYVLDRVGDPGSREVGARVLERADPDAAIGACDRQAALKLTRATVTERQGCVVFMVWDGAQFTGTTRAKDCASTVEGASYATSEVTISASRFISWDRGFALDDTQVWGAVKGPYEFDRRTALEARE